jgi:hypothetical protein
MEKDNLLIILEDRLCVILRAIAMSHFLAKDQMERDTIDFLFLPDKQLE